MFATLFVFSSFLHDNELVLSDTLLDDESVSIIFSGDIMGIRLNFRLHIIKSTEPTITTFVFEA